MKLTIIETPRATKTFGELKPGDVFRFEDGRYAKTRQLSDGWNTVVLDGPDAWDHVVFDSSDKVEPLDAVLIVRPLQQ